MKHDFCLNPETLENVVFIQCLHSGDHWITFTNYNPFYDCNHPTGLGLWFVNDSTNQQKKYIELIKPALKRLSEDKSRLTVLTTNMYAQYGTTDCGLIALAYAIAICEGKDPATLFFQQMSMRDHFNNCLILKSITQFDHVQTTVSPKYREVYVDISSEKLNV